MLKAQDAEVASPGRAIEGCGQRRGVQPHPRAIQAIHSTPNSACRKRNPCPFRHGADALRPAAKRTFHGQQNAHRRHPSGGDPGGGAARQSGRGVRLRVGEPPATARQYLSRQGHPGRAFAAGRLRRLRRQSPRLPGVFRNPPRLLPDPGRRPAGADRRGRTRASRRRGRDRPARQRRTAPPAPRSAWAARRDAHPAARNGRDRGRPGRRTRSRRSRRPRATRPSTPDKPRCRSRRGGAA